MPPIAFMHSSQSCQHEASLKMAGFLRGKLLTSLNHPGQHIGYLVAFLGCGYIEPPSGGQPVKIHPQYSHHTNDMWTQTCRVTTCPFNKQKHWYICCSFIKSVAWRTVTITIHSHTWSCKIRFSTQNNIVAVVCGLAITQIK